MEQRNNNATQRNATNTRRRPPALRGWLVASAKAMSSHNVGLLHLSECAVMGTLTLIFFSRPGMAMSVLRSYSCSATKLSEIMPTALTITTNDGRVASASEALYLLLHAQQHGYSPAALGVVVVVNNATQEHETAVRSLHAVLASERAPQPATHAKSAAMGSSSRWFHFALPRLAPMTVVRCDVFPGFRRVTTYRSPLPMPAAVFTVTCTSPTTDRTNPSASKVCAPLASCSGVMELNVRFKVSCPAAFFPSMDRRSTVSRRCCHNPKQRPKKQTNKQQQQQTTS